MEKTSDEDTKFEIGIYFVDTTYADESNETDEQWLAKSAALKKQLEEEYKLPFQDEDIAPGWSLPAFSTVISEYWPAGLIALFLAGEKIEKNIDAWSRLYDRLKRFVTRPVYLDRNGALVLASNAVITKCGALPHSLTIAGYSVWSVLEGEVAHDTSPIVGFADPPTTDRLSIMIHIFQIAADEKCFKVFVDGPKVQLIEMLSDDNMVSKITLG
jgi:hypothetical protein